MAIVWTVTYASAASYPCCANSLPAAPCNVAPSSSHSVPRQDSLCHAMAILLWVAKGRPLRAPWAQGRPGGLDLGPAPKLGPREPKFGPLGTEFAPGAPNYEPNFGARMMDPNLNPNLGLAGQLGGELETWVNIPKLAPRKTVQNAPVRIPNGGICCKLRPQTTLGRQCRMVQV